ncbi:MAG: hypothetical protein NTV23_02510 [Propionibacteriales bacterium]|nr:hypothetical protein [Propionibacteriales bacterium]
MRGITTSLIAAGAVAGLAGAVVTYQAAAGEATSQHTVVAPTAVETPAPIITMLPCEKGTKLVKGACVRTKHRIVVREAPAVTAAAAAEAVVPVPARPGPRSKDRNSTRPNQHQAAAPAEDRDHESEDESDHESEDHETEDHESEDHESEDELDD